jgi:hypothetical protein
MEQLRPFPSKTPVSFYGAVYDYPKESSEQIARGLAMNSSGPPRALTRLDLIPVAVVA